jgi:hypothetical protein
LEHFSNLSSGAFAYVGGEIVAVKNCEERYGRHVNSGMDFACQKL